MNSETAPTAWLEDIVFELTELDLMIELDPGLIGWDPLLLPRSH
jgi:hypothetical protein